MSDEPKVTILMSVYNGAFYLREAVESILRQTFTDYEFLIIDDGSSDESTSIIKAYDDPRIRVFTHSVNLGLVAALNRGIDLARGKYIARMDADDISLSTRLQKQFAYMEANSDVGICGAWVELFGEEESKGQIWRYPTRSEDIKSLILFESSLAHPSVIMRKDLFVQTGFRYDDRYIHAEDFALWAKFATNTSLANIPEVLLLHRVHGSRVGERYKGEQNESAAAVRRDQLRRFNIEITEKEFLLHQALSLYELDVSKRTLLDAERWLSKLKEANRVKNLYSRDAFDLQLSNRWYSACRLSAPLGLWVWWYYIKSSIFKTSNRSISDSFSLLIICLIKQMAP